MTVHTRRRAIAWRRHQLQRALKMMLGGLDRGEHVLARAAKLADELAVYLATKDGSEQEEVVK